MPKFRKKPVVIEAVRVPIGDYNAPSTFLLEVAKIADWCGGRLTLKESGIIMIPTLEGDMIASQGDWVIRGVKGEFYPCKPDVFAATYEPVNDGPADVTTADFLNR